MITVGSRQIKGGIEITLAEGAYAYAKRERVTLRYETRRVECTCAEFKRKDFKPYTPTTIDETPLCRCIDHVKRELVEAYRQQEQQAVAA